jgi:L-lactate dehydrogenase complex protein LldG
VNSRDAILAAIRAAGVPPAPPAVLPTTTPPTAELRERFIAAARAVGAEVVERAGRPVGEVLESRLGPERDEISVIPARFGVVENGAIYVDAADLSDRADVVRTEHLAVLLPGDTFVEDMHAAVRRMPAGSRCGWFVSGPSKTADIEQALVIGAQGARTLVVILDG